MKMSAALFCVYCATSASPQEFIQGMSPLPPGHRSRVQSLDWQENHRSSQRFACQGESLERCLLLPMKMVDAHVENDPPSPGVPDQL